jgi:hypothetical protein
MRGCAQASLWQRLACETHISSSSGKVRTSQPAIGCGDQSQFDRYRRPQPRVGREVAPLRPNADRQPATPREQGVGCVASQENANLRNPCMAQHLCHDLPESCRR